MHIYSTNWEGSNTSSTLKLKIDDEGTLKPYAIVFGSYNNGALLAEMGPALYWSNQSDFSATYDWNEKLWILTVATWGVYSAISGYKIEWV